MSDLYIKVKSAGTTGWQRPAEWLPMPEPEESKLHGLYFVFEDCPSNSQATFAASRTDQLSIDWGDGSAVENSVANTILYHDYDYDSLSGPINQYTEDGSNRNYKQVIVTITWISGLNSETFINLNLTRNNNTLGKPNFVDIQLYPEFAESWRLYIGGLKYLRIFKLLNNWGWSDGSNKNRTLYDMSDNTYEIFETPNMDIFTAYTSFQNTYMPNISFNNWGKSVSFAFRYAIVKSFEDINIPTNSGEALRGIKANYCKNVTINGNSADVFWQADINILGTIDATTSTNFRRQFQSCTTQKLIFTSIPSQPVNFGSNGGAFSSMPYLKELIVPGLERGFTIEGSNMGATALDAMFTSLGTASGAQTITITGNPGASTCDTTIATNKGFTVVI